jgi:hypothetical protein
MTLSQLPLTLIVIEATRPTASPVRGYALP